MVSFDLSSNAGPESQSQSSAGQLPPIYDSEHWSTPARHQIRNSWFPPTKLDMTMPPPSSSQEWLAPSSHSRQGSKSSNTLGNSSSKPSYIIPHPSLLYSGPEKDDLLHASPTHRKGSRRRTTGSHSRASCCNARAISTISAILLILIAVVCVRPTCAPCACSWSAEPLGLQGTINRLAHLREGRRGHH